MDKNIIMWNWIKQYPQFRKLYFNFGIAADGNSSFIPNPTDNVVKRDVLGNEIKCYDFAITAFKTISSVANSDENVLDYSSVASFIEWIVEQNKQENYPDFGANCFVEKLECVQSVPSQSGIDGDLAKYMVQCRITYIEYN